MKTYPAILKTYLMVTDDTGPFGRPTIYKIYETDHGKFIMEHPRTGDLSEITQSEFESYNII